MLFTKTVGSIGTNCYIIADEKTGNCLIVDPGDDAPAITRCIEQNNVHVCAILLTHGHFDHIGAVQELAERFAVKVYAGEQEKELLSDSYANLSMQFGREMAIKADVLLADQEQVTLGGMQFTVIATPGHTKGSVCYYFPEKKVLLSGDTLFCEGVGRTDYPTGSSRELLASLREKIFVLPGDTEVYPGHGEPTQIAYELENNPYA